MANLDIKTASVLAFERKLDPSDALFFAGNWDKRADSQNWSPIIVREKAVLRFLDESADREGWKA